MWLSIMKLTKTQKNFRKQMKKIKYEENTLSYSTHDRTVKFVQIYYKNVFKDC